MGAKTLGMFNEVPPPGTALTDLTDAEGDRCEAALALPSSTCALPPEEAIAILNNINRWLSGTPMTLAEQRRLAAAAVLAQFRRAHKRLALQAAEREAL